MDSHNKFGITLQNALDALGETQTTFAKKIGVNFSGLNQIIRGRPCGANVMRKCVASLAEPWNWRVLAAWTHDAVPPEWRDKITIGLSADVVHGSGAEEISDYSHLDERRRELVNWLISEIPEITIADFMDRTRALYGKGKK